MSDLLRHIADKLDEESMYVAVELTKGSAKDYAEYKYACGVAAGLHKAMVVLQETSNSLKEAEDNE